MSVNNLVKSMLGFCMKSGNIVSGEDTCKAELKRNKIYLIIVAVDASENTKKLFVDKTSYRNVPIRFIGSKEELGKSIGKNSRAVVAIKDENFALKLLQYIDGNDTTII